MVSYMKITVRRKFSFKKYLLLLCSAYWWSSGKWAFLGHGFPWKASLLKLRILNYIRMVFIGKGLHLPFFINLLLWSSHWTLMGRTATQHHVYFAHVWMQCPKRIDFNIQSSFSCWSRRTYVHKWLILESAFFSKESCLGQNCLSFEKLLTLISMLFLKE